MGNTFTFYLRCLVLFWVLAGSHTVSAQAWQWATVNTAPASTNVRSGCTATASDPAGNTVVAGFFAGSVVLGSTTLSSSGPNNSHEDLFVARFTPTGNCTQVVHLPSPGGGSRINGVAVDPSGVVVIAGDASGGVQFPTMQISGASFVARLSSTGTWAQVVAGGSGSAINALTLDAQGNAVVTGGFSRSTSTFGNFTLTGSFNRRNLFAARLSAAGVWTQAIQAVNTGESEGWDIKLDNNGNATVAGTFARSSVQFSNTTLTNAGGVTGNTGTDIVVARFGTTGGWTQAVSAGGPDNDTVEALTVDAGGTATITGLIRDNGVFGAIAPLQTSGNFYDGYLARLTPAGNWQQVTTWRRPNSVAPIDPRAMTTDSQGNSIVAIYGGVCRVTPAGQWTLLRDYSTGSGNHQVGGVVVASNGDIVLAGQLFGSASFDAIQVNPDARFMYFVARLGGIPASAKEESYQHAGQLTVFPQPAHATLMLAGVDGSVELLDSKGRIVRRFNVVTLPAQVDVSGLLPGQYWVRVGRMTKVLMID